MFRVSVITISVVIIVFVLLSKNVLAHPAWGIVVDNQGQIYVSDLETIWKIDPRGRQSVFRAGISGRHTHELTIDETGNLFGEDLTYEPSTKRYITAIWKMTPAGVFSYILQPTSNPPKGMSIWKDRTGNTYSLVQTDDPSRDILILKRTPAGNLTTLFSSQKAAGGAFHQVVMYSLGGVTFGTDGALYLTDRTNIQKVTMDGKVMALARNIPNENENSNTSILGITTDQQGNVFAADFGNRRVLKITPAGNISTVLQPDGSWSPTGVSFKRGDLYILETGNTSQRPRIRKLSSEGKVSLLATIAETSPPTVNPPPVALNTEPVSTATSAISYALIGFGASVLIMSFIVWRLRKNKVVKLTESKTH